MRHQDRLRALFAQIIDRGQTFAHPRVVGYNDGAIAFLDRNVEINANEHAFATDLEIAKGKFASFFLLLLLIIRTHPHVLIS